MAIEDIYSQETEKHCIAGLFHSPEILSEIDLFVKETDFFVKAHQTIFLVLRSMILAGERYDAVLLANKIAGIAPKHGDLTMFEYIELISYAKPTKEATIQAYQELLNYTIRRQGIENLRIMARKLQKPGDKKTSQLMSELDKIYTEWSQKVMQGHGKPIIEIASGIEYLVEDRRNNPPKESEMMMGPFPTINKVYGSLSEPGAITVVGARSGVGKSQPIWSKVLTPTGWIKIGDLKVGDFVMGSDGSPTEVLGVFPQGVLDYYKVSFDDDTFTHCSDNHLWLTKNYKQRRNKTNNFYTVKTLNEIRHSITTHPDNPRINHNIPWQRPVQYAAKGVKIHPYIMGALLGDGCLSSNNISFTKPDINVITKIKLYSNPLDKIRDQTDKRNGCLTIAFTNNSTTSFTDNGNNRSQISNDIEFYGLLGTYSYSKFIPKDYLINSEENRWELLRGLLDTDGGVCYQKATTIEYSTASERLKDGVLDLVRGLGGRATWSTKKPTYDYKGEKHEGRLSYRIFISFHYPVKPFSSPTKSNKFAQKTRPLKRYIKKVELAGQDECVCIKVAAKDSLYLTDDYILTHNTSMGLFYNIHLAMQNSQELLWLDSSEMSVEQLQFRILCILTRGKVPLWCIKSGDWAKNEEWAKLVRAAIPETKKIKIYYESTYGLKTNEIIKLIRNFSYRIGKDKKFLVCLDYLKSMDGDNPYEREWVVLGDFVNDIKNFIQNEVNIPFWTSLQLNRSGITTNKKKLEIQDNEGTFGMSDRILQQASHAFLLRHKLLEEIQEENGQFGNMAAIFLKHRELGREAAVAMRPIKLQDGSYAKNHVNMYNETFFFEDKGLYSDAIQQLKNKYDLKDKKPKSLEDSDII